MSTYLYRNSLVGCLFAAGLLGGLSSIVLAKENGSDHSTIAPAQTTDKPAITASNSMLDHGSMDHSKMSHESMDHDQKIKKED
ncbi:hypothetical protein GH769_00230 [Pseudomonas sp. CFSAN084952]|uniref:hypothetical protein n=1 Tax=Pseudomonas TaxID=286 RepID=UPI001299E2F5|nr:hypothetical protein [Pseudomonas sp. CFSAN084952]QGF91720.1 hypothetical protein GH769_00230 [Pseudomonas sp. CFSAN084952]